MINLRSYDEVRRKRTLTINEGWRFIADKEKSLTQSEAAAALAGGVSVEIPSVWNYIDGLFDYEGVGWYSCGFNAEAGKYKLVFEGVCNDAEVWLDGEKITEHRGAFLGFATYIDLAESGRHTLTVRVSNITNTESTIPASE